MNLPTEHTVAASEYFDYLRLPLRRRRRDVMCRVRVAAERTRRGTRQAPDEKGPGRTIPAVPTGRSAN